MSKVTNLILEGYSLREARLMTEAVLDAADAESFIKSPFYKGLERNAMQMLKKVEDADGYRDEREEDPRRYVEDELDELEYAASMFTGLKLISFPGEVEKGILKLIKSANNGVKRGHEKLNATPDDKILKAFKPLEYTQRALVFLSDCFKLLGIQWDYDYQWENYLFSADPGNTKTPASTDSSGKRIIDYGVPEERAVEMYKALVEAEAENKSYKEMVQEIRVTKSEKDFFKEIWKRFGLN